jgi:hypothetical protein
MARPYYQIFIQITKFVQVTDRQSSKPVLQGNRAHFEQKNVLT